MGDSLSYLDNLLRKVNTHWQDKIVFAVSLCVSFVARQIFSSKSLENSSKKMFPFFPFNFQFSGNNCGFC